MFEAIKDRRAVRRVFDREFYLRTYPDVAAAKIDPLLHYLKDGAPEHRQPHPLFDPAHYLGCCPDARNSANALLHYLNTNQGRWPATHPLFDSEAYLRAHPDAGNPLVDCVERAAHPVIEGSQFGQ